MYISWNSNCQKLGGQGSSKKVGAGDIPARYGHRFPEKGLRSANKDLSSEFRQKKKSGSWGYEPLMGRGIEDLRSILTGVITTYTTTMWHVKLFFHFF
jgi:hypothetical protein